MRENLEMPLVEDASAMDSTSSVGLLAIRKAAGHFWGRHNIRSDVFEALLHEYDSLSRQILNARDVLLQELYEAVPRAQSPSARHSILEIKRKVAHFVAAADQELDVLAADQRARVREYFKNISARETILDRKRESIFHDFRRQLGALADDEEFNWAVTYSCPWLIEAYRRHNPSNNTDFSKEERGIYSYAARFFSKANPFHLFASVILPHTVTISLEDRYEILLNISTILRLEQVLLLQCKDKSKIRLYLRSFIEQDKTWEFVLPKGSSLRRIVVPKIDLIRLISEFFATIQPEYTLDRCLAYLGQHLPHIAKSDIESSLFQLIDHGVLVRYLVADFNNFANDLLSIDRDYDAQIISLQAIHLARVAKKDLSDIKQKLDRLPEMGSKDGEASYYLNAYSVANTEEYEQAASQLRPSLQAIRPLFLPYNNFEEWSRVTSAFMRDYCHDHPAQRIPYAVLMMDFCRNLGSIIARYQISNDRHFNGHKQRESDLWNYQGSLSDQELQAIVERSLIACDAKTICFNGAYDRGNGRFYPHNFFSGNGRYISRYLLGVANNPFRRVRAEADVQDVQLVPTYDHNRLYVTQMFDTGCGFDARYRHKFRHWIDLNDVFVENQNGKIIFSHRSGCVLRFHFVGFLLGQGVRPEYQLLLTEHTDYFKNPFERPPSSDKPLEYCTPLYYRDICLRREQWRFAKDVFEPAWKYKDILRCTLSLREILREGGMNFKEAYFELFDPVTQWRKPRYFDTSNPLSAHAFRRAVRSSSSGTVVSIAKMEPQPASLFKDDEGSYVTELMIEA
jgi:hypothetical protein